MLWTFCSFFCSASVTSSRLTFVTLNNSDEKTLLTGILVIYKGRFVVSANLKEPVVIPICHFYFLAELLFTLHLKIRGRERRSEEEGTGNTN